MSVKYILLSGTSGPMNEFSLNSDCTSFSSEVEFSPKSEFSNLVELIVEFACDCISNSPVVSFSSIVKLSGNHVLDFCTRFELLNDVPDDVEGDELCAVFAVVVGDFLFYMN